MQSMALEEKYAEILAKEITEKHGYICHDVFEIMLQMAITGHTNVICTSISLLIGCWL